MAVRFNAAGHPDVIAGTVTAEEAQQVGTCKLSIYTHTLTHASQQSLGCKKMSALYVRFLDACGATSCRHA